MSADPACPDLPAAVSREIFTLLCDMLPPPLTDDADDRAARDTAAMAAVGALHPVDAFEAGLAARVVAMEAHAADCLRLAGLAADPVEQRRCRAQAAGMTRQADTGLRALLRIQSVRDKQLHDMQPAAMERAGYWFRDISVPATAPQHEPSALSPVDA